MQAQHTGLKARQSIFFNDPLRQSLGQALFSLDIQQNLPDQLAQNLLRQTGCGGINWRHGIGQRFTFPYDAAFGMNHFRTEETTANFTQ